MTDVVTLAIIGGIGAMIATIPPSILAYATLQQSKTNALSAKIAALATEVAQKEIVDKTNTVIEKATEIHTLTNSNLSRVTAQLEVANTKIEGLQTLLVSLSTQHEELKQQIPSLSTSLNVQQPVLSGDKIPIPVVDDKVVEKLDGMIVEKLDKIQDAVEK